MLESTNKLDPSGADNIKKIFAEVRTEQDYSRYIQTIGIVLMGIAASFLISTVVASIVVIRNRKAVKSAFKQGYLKAQKEEFIEETVAEEFMKNYIQKGGE